MLRSIKTVRDEYDFLDKWDRYSLLIDLGRELEAMPAALKTDITRVQGCQASVWAYPVKLPSGSLHFYADSDSAIIKGIIALVLLAVQDRTASEILQVNIAEELKPFEVEKHLTSRRTSGIPNMIKLIEDTARRIDESA